MARDNEQICLLAFNVFSSICVIYSCISIDTLVDTYTTLEDSDKELCYPYLVWKIIFMLHIIFFLVCLSFSVGTAQTYLNEDGEEQHRPSEHIYRLKFEKMVENSLDVVRMICLLFCGPMILVECILSIAYYTSIVNDCSQIIPDGFTNVLIYVLIIAGCISITVTVFCFYSTYHVAKVVKDCWPEIRNPSLIHDNEDAQSILSSEENNRGRGAGRGRRVAPPALRQPINQRQHSQSQIRQEQQDRLNQDIEQFLHLMQQRMDQRRAMSQQFDGNYEAANYEYDDEDEEQLDEQQRQPRRRHSADNEADDEEEDYQEYYGEEEYYDEEEESTQFLQNSNEQPSNQENRNNQYDLNPSLN